MDDFQLIDLFSQREAVLKLVSGWSREAVLDWLNRFGTVTALTVADPNAYRFCSVVGLTTVIRFDEADRLDILTHGGYYS